jgi:hypothetical protein
VNVDVALALSVANVAPLWTIAPTLKVKLKVPLSPLVSSVVPVTLYCPAGSVPTVVTSPVAETRRSEDPPDLVNVVVPSLPVTTSCPAYVFDETVDTEPVVGAP